MQAFSKRSFTLTILGSGTSTGVPVPTCPCKVCRSQHPRNQRLRASAWVQIQGKNFLIDTSTDLRLQALRQKIPRVDAVLYTHPHADHVHGIDELRCFNYVQRQSIPLYGNSWTFTELQGRFGYIFKPGPVEGGGIPQLTLKLFDPNDQSIDVCGVPIIPISVPHGSKECVGYRFESVAYITDCSYIPSSSLDRLRELSVLVLDCVRLKPHRTHLNLEQALEIVSELKPRKTYLTHLGHEMDYRKWVKELPKGVFFAYDGLKIRQRGSS